jgi:hypothetical protein
MRGCTGKCDFIGIPFHRAESPEDFRIFRCEKKFPPHAVHRVAGVVKNVWTNPRATFPAQGALILARAQIAQHRQSRSDARHSRGVIQFDRRLIE